MAFVPDTFFDPWSKSSFMQSLRACSALARPQKRSRLECPLGSGTGSHQVPRQRSCPLRGRRGRGARHTPYRAIRSSPSRKCVVPTSSAVVTNRSSRSECDSPDQRLPQPLPGGPAHRREPGGLTAGLVTTAWRVARRCSSRRGQTGQGAVASGTAVPADTDAPPAGERATSLSLSSSATGTR